MINDIRNVTKLPRKKKEMMVSFSLLIELAAQSKLWGTHT